MKSPALIACLSMVSCSSFVTYAPVGLPTIILNRDGCLGTCPVYWVRVTPDGLIRFEGSSYVSDPGRHEARIASGELERLGKALEEADVQSLKDTYLTPADGCDAWGVDAGEFTITVIRGTVQKNVRYSFTCEGLAVRDDVNRLRRFADAIDEIAGTAQWVGIHVHRE